MSCARRLRTRMLAEAGDPADPPLFLLEAVADEVAVCCGHTALKAHRLACGWTVEAAVAAFHAMCREHKLGARGLAVRSWLEWEAGDYPNADYQDLLCRLFRTGPVRLGFARSYGEPGALMARPAPAARHAPPAVGDIVGGVARESFAHAAATEATEVGPMTLDQIEVDVAHLARSYVHAAPFPVFTELVRLRREVCGLLSRVSHPAQAGQLVLVAGQVCGLLANASLDLGSPRAAATQARSAWTYASTIGHHGLRAWVRGLQTMIAYWSGGFEEAVVFARAGQPFTSSATARARLGAIEALAWAGLAAERDARAALRTAEDARDRSGGSDELHDAIAGEFGFTRAKQTYLAGGAYIHLGLPDRAAASARAAIQLYASGPPAERSYGNEALAHVDLVTAHLMEGELEAAYEAADDVFGLPESRRIDGLAQRLRAARRLLLESRYHREPRARELVERIDAFQVVNAALPSAGERPVRQLR